MKSTKYILISLLLGLSLISFAQNQKKLVIIHTNDVHSRVEPLPEGERFERQSGALNRKVVIDSIRKVEDNVLLVDAGDIIQGTPYFNMYNGRVEAGIMNRIGYEVGTIGNHEFDNGLDSLKMIYDIIDFPIVCCNYDFTGTPLAGMTKPYIVLDKKGIKVGIVGATVDPDGLIQKDKYEGATFKPIVETVNHYAEILRNKEKCDLVIALTHIGIESDKELAEKSKDIDLIIGGHSHTYLKQPVMKKNLDGKEVLIHQVGKNGAFVGEIEILFDKK